MKSFLFIPVVIILFLPSIAFSASPTLVQESKTRFLVLAEAPISMKAKNEKDGMKQAQEDALVWAHKQFLTEVLKKEAKSGRILAVLEMVSPDLQKEIRDYIKTARTEDVEFKNKICRMKVLLDKEPLKEILKRY